MYKHGSKVQMARRVIVKLNHFILAQRHQSKRKYHIVWLFPSFFHFIVYCITLQIQMISDFITKEAPHSRMYPLDPSEREWVRGKPPGACVLWYFRPAVVCEDVLVAFRFSLYRPCTHNTHTRIYGLLLACVSVRGCALLNLLPHLPCVYTILYLHWPNVTLSTTSQHDNACCCPNSSTTSTFCPIRNGWFYNGLNRNHITTFTSCQ